MNKISKIVLAASLFSAMAVVPTISAVAANSNVSTVPRSELTQEQQKILEAADQVTVSEKVKSSPITTNALTAAATTSKTVTFKRGSSLAWSEATVDWSYNGNAVTNSSAHQDAGYIFPSIVRKNGITKQTSSASSYHIYLSKTTIGAGSVTPWGDVTVYNNDYSDYIRVNKDGTSSHY
ncbi:hypothetical protein L2089_19515 [Paenibacillus hunanensis]|uniref:hypothetical protein n=1 Tax=Paenibacillus hunanensis TaxID=539262 RepID=UPI002026254F|nr:hypothetical protein [Paenibacillus hunanensis]MCL9662882.1 hypothetical protein [Paenibacillus hunanensis]